jgi:hypothetical protein
MSDKEIIEHALGRIRRRLWVRDAGREIAFGACVFLFGLLSFVLLRPVLAFGMPSVVVPAGMALALALVLGMLAVAWRASRPVTVAQAAGEADARAVLHDELKSAWYFLSDGRLSEFEALQVSRAAGTVAGLDPREIVPAEIPRLAGAAAGLGILLALIVWLTPQLSGSWIASEPADGVGKPQPGDLRSALEGAPADAEAENLDRALQVLQDAGASDEEKRNAAIQARDAIDQVNMEAAAAREALARLAETIKSDPRMDKLAEALQQGRTEEAQALVQKMLAEPAASASAQEQDVAPADRGTEATRDQAPELAGRTLSGVNDKINKEAMETMLRAVEKARQRFDLQRNVNTVRRRMEDQMAASSRRDALTANEFGRNITAPNPTPSPETGNSEMQGGTMFREAAKDRHDGEPEREGSRTGSPSGHAEALPVEGAATRRLEAQLKREAIGRRDEEDDAADKGAKKWFYAPSREQKSDLQFGGVRSRATFDRGAAMDRDAVPLAQKRIVKDYFMNLHESENQ